MTDHLSTEDGRVLLAAARQTLAHKLEKQSDFDKDLSAEIYRELMADCRGVFVSLYKQGKLRGCIGNLEPDKPVFTAVVDNACHAAFRDSRFSPMQPDELDQTQIEISILTRPELLAYETVSQLLSKIKPGVHGVIIKKGRYKATFLPQVWEQLPEPADFLSHLCVKAGLPKNAWEDADLIVSTYEVQVFEETAGPGRA